MENMRDQRNKSLEKIEVLVDGQPVFMDFETTSATDFPGEFKTMEGRPWKGYDRYTQALVQRVWTDKLKEILNQHVEVGMRQAAEQGARERRRWEKSVAGSMRKSSDRPCEPEASGLHPQVFVSQLIEDSWANETWDNLRKLSKRDLEIPTPEINNDPVFYWDNCHNFGIYDGDKVCLVSDRPYGVYIPASESAVLHDLTLTRVDKVQVRVDGVTFFMDFVSKPESQFSKKSWIGRVWAGYSYEIKKLVLRIWREKLAEVRQYQAERVEENLAAIRERREMFRFAAVDPGSPPAAQKVYATLIQDEDAWINNNEIQAQGDDTTDSDSPTPTGSPQQTQSDTRTLGVLQEGERILKRQKAYSDLREYFQSMAGIKRKHDDEQLDIETQSQLEGTISKDNNSNLDPDLDENRFTAYVDVTISNSSRLLAMIDTREHENYLHRGAAQWLLGIEKGEVDSLSDGHQLEKVAVTHQGKTLYLDMKVNEFLPFDLIIGKDWELFWEKAGEERRRDEDVEMEPNEEGIAPQTITVLAKVIEAMEFRALVDPNIEKSLITLAGITELTGLNGPDDEHWSIGSQFFGVEITYKEISMTLGFEVIDSATQDIILGKDWLADNRKSLSDSFTTSFVLTTFTTSATWRAKEEDVNSVTSSDSDQSVNEDFTRERGNVGKDSGFEEMRIRSAITNKFMRPQVTVWWHQDRKFEGTMWEKTYVLKENWSQWLEAEYGKVKHKERSLDMWFGRNHPEMARFLKKRRFLSTNTVIKRETADLI
ncbi:hypothetical protein C8J56DRAFT_1057945 [Mycena floridula]|nr:hypothetical protein C8J56DRAFT_1057945 [Mycena floridula]